MKRGDTVAVCYDGKWSRRVKGIVLATRQTGRIQVRFNSYDDDTETTKWFPRRSRPHRHGGKPFYYGGHVTDDTSLGSVLFGMPGDWYSVYEWEETA